MDIREIHDNLESEVAKMVEDKGYKVKRQARLGRFSRYRADILAQYGGKKIAIECKVSPVIMADIAAVRKLEVDSVILCVPAEVKREIAQSTFDFAQQNGVHIFEPDDIKLSMAIPPIALRPMLFTQ